MRIRFDSRLITTGHLTSAELTQLDSEATAIANTDLSGNPQCEAAPNLGSAFIDMKLNNGSTSRIVNIDPNANSVCYRGNRQDAINLLNTLGDIDRKYYPTASH